MTTNSTRKDIKIIQLRAALAALTDGMRAGLASDDIGTHCVYCEGKSENYPKVWTLHELQCPILQGRRILRE